ncbi:ribosomal protein S18-alanine N-acetyltransferase [Clostridiaceae bacterium M8S5]|nr:ribosomal protein S18-alanine N-acetyltransferase [Clostridiaceae bacterium M8S5]
MKKRTGDNMSDVTIREMILSDIEAVCEIENKSFTTPWSKNAFIDEIKNNKLAYYIVIKSGKSVVGYAGMWLILDEAHITNVAIHPNYRGKGLANHLINGVLDSCKQKKIQKVTLEVREYNKTAISLYKKFGFYEFGKRIGYYTDTKEDAIIMWLDMDCNNIID